MGHQGQPILVAHMAGRVKAQIAGKAPGARKIEDQDTRNNRDRTAHRGNQATQVVGQT